MAEGLSSSEIVNLARQPYQSKPEGHRTIPGTTAFSETELELMHVLIRLRTQADAEYEFAQRFGEDAFIFQDEEYFREQLGRLR